MLLLCETERLRTVQLSEVKEQCVRIVGMLGGSINHALVTHADPTHLEKLAVAWDSHKHLRFDVPFQDVKPTIYFGKSGPRNASCHVDMCLLLLYK